MSENHKSRVKGWLLNEVLHLTSSHNILLEFFSEMLNELFSGHSYAHPLVNPQLPFFLHLLYNPSIHLSVCHIIFVHYKVSRASVDVECWGLQSAQCLLGSCLNSPGDGKFTTCYGSSLHLLWLSPSSLLCEWANGKPSQV